MSSPESTSDSSWNNTSVPTVITTNDGDTDPGSIPPRHQTSMLGIDIHTDITDNQLARPAQYNQEYLAATRVMSPSTMMALGSDNGNSMNECNTSLLLGQHVCQLCAGLGSEMMVCAECGTVGHSQCM